MAGIRDSAKLFNPASFEFPEFLLSNLGSDGKIPFWAKCIGFGALLYGVGIMVNFVSNTLFPWTSAGLEQCYLMDHHFMVVSAVMGCTLALFLSTLRKLDDALIKVSERTGAISTTDDEKKFKDFVSWMRRWMPAGERFYLKPSFLYYLDTIGGAILGALFGIYWSFNSTFLHWGRSQYTVSALYYIFVSAMIAYTAGAVIFVTLGSVQAVRRYCKTFITPERVLALNPDKVGGLRPLGQFSLGLDIAFALPSLVAFRYLAFGGSIANPVVMVTLLIYTFTLIVVFFIPLSAAHNSMLEAKDRAYDQVNEIFRDINSKISTGNKKFNAKHIKALKDVHFLHEKVSKMAVWPLNIDIILKFVATSLFPMIGSLTIAYAPQILGT